MDMPLVIIRKAIQRIRRDLRLVCEASKCLGMLETACFLPFSFLEAVKAEAGRLSNHHFPARNKNRISHFQWLEELLSMIVEGKQKAR